MTDFWLGFLTCLAAIFAAGGFLLCISAIADDIVSRVKARLPELSGRHTDADVQRLRRRKQTSADATPRGLSGGRRA